MGKIFVAGATGSLGTAVLAAMHGKNVDVVAGVYDPDRKQILQDLGVETRLFDLEDVDGMAQAMAGCESLFLSLPLQARMTRFGHLAVEAAKKAAIGYIVRSSGYAASSDAHWRLGRELGMVDQFVEDSGIPYTLLRPNTLMQQFSGPLAPMVRSGALTLPEENASVSYIDVRDVADCAVKILLEPIGFENGTYALTGPEGLSLADVAARIGAAAGVEVNASPESEEAYLAQLQESGDSQWTMDMKISLSRVIKLGMAGNVTQAVEFITGSPARSFTAFAEEHVAVWR